MESEKTKYEEMRILICELVDGTITPDRIARLNQILANDSQAVNHYIDFLDIQVLIKSNLSIEKDFSAPVYSDEIRELTALWHDLANEERSAPEIERSEEKPGRPLIHKVVYPECERRKTSKFSLYFLVLNTAAILFFFLFLKLASPKDGYEVATLTDCVSAKWADMAAPMAKGTRIVTTHKSLLLADGYAELLFDTNARVVIEGPAEFRILAEDRIGLNYGKLYSYVPKEAAGFSVYSHNVKIVDIGTEFGVDVDSEGSTQLHVLQGKTILIAGDKLNKEGVEVGKGIAKKVSFHTQTISDISCRDNLFVRDIDSRSALVWRGETEVSLADIVGGGNGFGTGRLDYGIMIDTGKLSTGPLFIGDYNIHYRPTQNAFRPVPDIAAVDGIFVPNGRSGDVVVSSQGHRFEDCPETSSTWCVPIINGARYKSDSDVRFKINGQTYGTAENPALFLHANVGITYDLNVIRSMLPAGKTLTHFASIGTVLDDSPFGEPGLADVWMLVDGQLRFSKTNVAPSEFFDIDIPLSGENRFLSLVVTDGVGDRSDAKRKKDGFDWFLFGTPKLTIE